MVLLADGHQEVLLADGLQEVRLADGLQGKWTRSLSWAVSWLTNVTLSRAKLSFKF